MSLLRLPKRACRNWTLRSALRCLSTTVERHNLSSGGYTAHLHFHGNKKYPILNPEAIQKLTYELAKLNGQDELRALFLRSTIAGADINHMKNIENASQAQAFIQSVDKLCSSVQQFHAPVIAIIDGPCMGAGMEVAASCDMRIAIDDRKTIFAMPETKIGIPSVVQASLLPGLIGWGRARQLLYFGGQIPAQEAHTIGFVNELTTRDELPEAVARWERLVDESEPRAVADQKRLMNVSPPALIPELLLTHIQDMARSGYWSHRDRGQHTSFWAIL